MASFELGVRIPFCTRSGCEKLPNAGLTVNVQAGAHIDSYVRANRVIAGDVLFGRPGAGMGGITRNHHNDL